MLIAKINHIGYGYFGEGSNTTTVYQRQNNTVRKILFVVQKCGDKLLATTGGVKRIDIHNSQQPLKVTLDTSNIVHIDTVNTETDTAMGGM